LRFYKEEINICFNKIKNLEKIIMKKTFLLLILLCCSYWIYGASTNGTVTDNWLMVEDYEGYTLEDVLQVSNASISAVVKESPVSTQAAYLSGANNSHYLIVNATLPAGKVLADLDSLSFDLYIESASYKNLEIWINGTKVHSVGNLINGTGVNLGVKKFAFADFNQAGAATVIENATGTVAIGIGPSRMSGTTFYVDNVKLQGEGLDTPVIPDIIYTATLNPGTGTCASVKVSETEEGSGVILPSASPSSRCAVAGYTFAGWAGSVVDETSTEPEMLPAGLWLIPQDTTIYAVYTDGSIYNTNPSCSNSLNGTITDNWLMVEDYEGYTLDTDLPVSNASISAVVKENPTSTQAAYLSGANNSYYLIVNATLPTGKVLADFDSLSLNLYIESASYKNLELWINDTKVHSVGNLVNGTNVNLGVRKFAFADFNQAGAATVVENATGSVAIGIGPSRMTGTTFYVDDVKLKIKDGTLTSLENLEEDKFSFFYSDNEIRLAFDVDELTVYDLNGRKQTSMNNVSFIDISNLHTGVYIVKVGYESNTIVKKIIKK